MLVRADEGVRRRVVQGHEGPARVLCELGGEQAREPVEVGARRIRPVVVQEAPVSNVSEADDRLEDGEAEGRYEGLATCTGAGRGGQAPAPARPAGARSCRRRVHVALARRGGSLHPCRPEIAAALRAPRGVRGEDPEGVGRGHAVGGHRSRGGRPTSRAPGPGARSGRAGLIAPLARLRGATLAKSAGAAGSTRAAGFGRASTSSPRTR